MLKHIDHRSSVMTKILLVEDDKSLREIYGVRLFAEGYDVVSAGDGEQALAVAIKERPALIITDVMMPKISGFDMLDILRSTTETKDIKVIVMTALGSDDNRERGERLGADKYLVKSQVGIEDVIREVHNLLGDQAATPQASVQMPSQQPPASAAMMAPTGVPAPGSGRPMQNSPQGPQSAFAPPSSAMGASDIPSRRPRVIQPIGNPGAQVDIQALVDKELAKEGRSATTVAEQRQVVNSQLNSFSNQPAATPAPSGNPTATPPPSVPAAGTNMQAPPSSLPQPQAAQALPAPMPAPSSTPQMQQVAQTGANPTPQAVPSAVPTTQPAVQPATNLPQPSDQRTV